MCDTAFQLEAAQLLENLIVGAAAVQQHRQVMVARDLQLLDIEVFLRRVVQPRREQVQPDLAYRHRSPAFDPGTQVGQMRFLMHMDIHRMHAPGRQTAGVTPASGFHSGEIVPRHRGNDLDRDTGIERAPMDVIAVGGEFGGIKVAVSVDELRRGHDLESSGTISGIIARPSRAPIPL